MGLTQYLHMTPHDMGLTQYLHTSAHNTDFTQYLHTSLHNTGLKQYLHVIPHSTCIPQFLLTPRNDVILTQYLYYECLHIATTRAISKQAPTCDRAYSWRDYSAAPRTDIILSHIILIMSKSSLIISY